MKTVALLNQKGGVGKTSLTMHLSGALADAGLTVLAVDYDGQSSLTQGIIGPDAAERLEGTFTAAEIAAVGAIDPRDSLQCHSSGDARFFYVPGSPRAHEFNVANPFRLGGERMRLRRFLRQAAELNRGPARIDVCLIDCPPNLQMLAAQALAAADFLVIPTEAEDFGAQGLRPVLRFMEESRAEDNPALKLAGIVINGRKRVSLHAAYEKRIREHYREDVFAAVVPGLVGYPEAIAYHQPITWHDPRSNAAEAMRVLAAELVERIGGGR